MKKKSNFLSSNLAFIISVILLLIYCIPVNSHIFQGNNLISGILSGLRPYCPFPALGIALKDIKYFLSKVLDRYDKTKK